MKAPIILSVATAALAPICLLFLTGWQGFNPARKPIGKLGQQTMVTMPIQRAQLAFAIVNGQRVGDLSQATLGRSSVLNFDTVVTGNPQIICDEDFTDGAFDNLNALNSDPRRLNNWGPFGGGVAFRPAQDRTTFPVSFARKPALGGADWEGLQYQVFQDTNGDGRFSTAEKRKWYVDKKDEVCIVEFTSFSDLAAKPETYGTEVAMLEDTDEPAFQGNPHYGHDLSFEVLQSHSVDRTQASVQVEPNVENTGNRSSIGVLRSHYNGWPTDVELGKEYTQMTIWRNRPGTGTTNVEQWGAFRYGDMSIASEMNSDLEPTNKYSVFNNIQVAFFRAGIRTTNPILVRSTIAARDSAQIGILRCKVGITKKCDFDLNYSVGASDVAILTNNLGRTDSANIRTGDADNNTKVDANDANSLIGLWTEARPAFDSIKAYGTYNPADGHIYLSLKNISYLKISSLNRRLNRTNANISGLNATGSLVSDSSIIAYTGAEWTVSNLDLGPAASLALQAGELSLRVNYKGSKESEGFEIPFATLLVTQNSLPVNGLNTTLLLDGNQFAIPTYNQAFDVNVFTTDGKLLYHNHQAGTTSHLIDLSNIRLPMVPKVIMVTGKNRKRLMSRTYTAF